MPFLLPSALVSTSHRFSTFAFEEVGSVVNEHVPLERTIILKF